MINIENINGQIWYFDGARGVAYADSPNVLRLTQDVTDDAAAEAIKNNGVSFVLTKAP